MNVGEAGLALEGMYIYLLTRDDLWLKHHALIKAIRKQFSHSIDFDELELSVMDDGRYCDAKATLEWRAKIISELNERISPNE